MLACSLPACSSDGGGDGGGGAGGAAGTGGSAGGSGTAGSGGAAGSGGTDIGPDGGTAISEDGFVTVEVPAGALSETQTIRITPVGEAPDGALAGTVYELGPAGLRFDAPVTLELAYDEGALPAGLDEGALSVATLANGIFWREVVGASVDAARNTVTVQAMHFSTWGLRIGAFEAPLSQGAVVPPSGSAASGTAVFSFDTSANVLSYHVTFSGLEGNETEAAIRGPALPGATGPVLHTLGFGSPKIGHWTYDEADEPDLLAGRGYLEIRSEAHPGGEVRGQIEPVGPVASASQLTVNVLLCDDLSGSSASNQIPAAVARLEVEVSGADMATQIQALALGTPPLVANLTVQKGMARQVHVRAYDDADQVVYRAATLLDIQNATHVIQPTMWSAVDVTAPTFAGVTSATSLAGDAIMLAWSAASDDYAGAGEIAYAVYAAATSGGQNFSSPLYATAPGETSHTVRGLAAGQTHYFVVRAIDPVGNLDANTVEASASTFSAGTGQYVDARTGVDGPGCGTPSSPCRTITHALTQSPGDEPIYIARGLYDAAAGEAFPLQLKDGVSLHGDLAFVQTLPTRAGGVQIGTLVPTPVLRTTTEIQAILGADRTHISGLFIEEGSNSNVGTIDAVGHAIDVAWCVLEGSGNATLPTTAIRVAPGSSVRDSVVKDYSSRGITGFGDDMLIYRNAVVRSGIWIAVEAGDWVISRNVVHGNSLGGVYTWDIDGARGGSIVRNWIHQNNWGIQLERVYGTQVIANSIRRSQNEGIRIFGFDGVPPTSSRITGNRLKENGAGILIWSDANPIVRGNDIACNDYTDLGTWGSQQIDARNNYWDHAPPTLYLNAGSNLTGCDPAGVDVCIAALSAGTPQPELAPASGTSSCGSSALGVLR